RRPGSAPPLPRAGRTILWVDIFPATWPEFRLAICCMKMNLMNNAGRTFQLTLGGLILAVIGLRAEDPARLLPISTNATAAAEVPQSYRLSPNDVVRIRVFQEDDLTTELRLGKDGSGTFPLLGI